MSNKEWHRIKQEIAHLKKERRRKRAQERLLHKETWRTDEATREICKVVN